METRPETNGNVGSEKVAAEAPSARMRVRRLPQRGHYDAKTIHAILDAGLVCHVGYVFEGQPYVTPTSYWRDGDRVYWHGSSASRMLRSLGAGPPACLAVTIVDGLVMARSGFNHSMNYRSVMVVGTARLVLDSDHKLKALRDFMERVAPGRWPELRPTTAQELKATTVLWMPLDEASAKIRTGDPIDAAEDYAQPCWAGVVPIRTVLGTPEPDRSLDPSIEMPAYLHTIRIT